MTEQDAPRKVALLANCLLNQNAKVCEGARYRGLVSPVVKAYRAHCRRPARAIALLIERHLRRGDEVILIGLDGSPSSGVRFTSSRPDWGGRLNRPEDDWEIVPRRGPRRCWQAERIDPKSVGVLMLPSMQQPLH
jgi:hypothetical protein